MVNLFGGEIYFGSIIIIITAKPVRHLTNLMRINGMKVMFKTSIVKVLFQYRIVAHFKSLLIFMTIL